VRIRKTTYEDIPSLLDIFANAREIQKATGNAGQWKEGHPSKETIKKDIQEGHSYVCVVDEGDQVEYPAGTIAATVVIMEKIEPTYEYIEGEWLNDQPYITIHRIATSGKVKGAGLFIMEEAINTYDNIRIDTTRRNKPMLGLIEKFGFTYCGIIYVEDGTERLAYQLVK